MRVEQYVGGVAILGRPQDSVVVGGGWGVWGGLVAPTSITDVSTLWRAYARHERERVVRRVGAGYAAA